MDYYDNPKSQKERVRPGEVAPSKPKENIHGSKLVFSIWWDEEDVIFFYRGIHLLPENGKTLYFSMESILNEIYFILLFQFLLYFL